MNATPTCPIRSCSECSTAAETTASYCARCFRPLPRLKQARWFLPSGSLADAIHATPEAAREAPSVTTAEPLPEILVRDIEAIRGQGQPQRDGPFFCGTPSAGFVALRRWCFATPILVMIGPAIAAGCYLKLSGDPSYGMVFLALVLVGVVLAFVGYGVGTVIARLQTARLQGMARGDRLLADRREFVYVAPEGLVWHDGRGLLYLPWEGVADAECQEDPEKQHTLLGFTDCRTQTRHVLETYGFVGIYRRSQLRDIAREVVARVQAVPPSKVSPHGEASVAATQSPAPATPDRAAARPALTQRICSHCGVCVVPKADGTCPACQHTMHQPKGPVKQ